MSQNALNCFFRPRCRKGPHHFLPDRILPRRQHSLGPPLSSYYTVRLYPILKLGETQDDGLEGSLRLVDMVDLHRINPRRILDGCVIAPRVQRVAEKEHVPLGNGRQFGQTLHAVGLVDASAGDVDRGGAADADRDVGQEGLQVRLDLATLLLLGVPGLLGVQRRLLAQGREGDLAAAVLDLLAPDLGRREAQPVDGGAQLVDDVGALVVGEEVGVLAGPGGGGLVVAVQLGARGGHQPEASVVRRRGQSAGDLLLELRPVAAANDTNVGDVAESPQNRRHLVVERLLALRQRAIQVECNEPLHGM